MSAHPAPAYSLNASERNCLNRCSEAVLSFNATVSARSSPLPKPFKRGWRTVTPVNDSYSYSKPEKVSAVQSSLTSNLYSVPSPVVPSMPALKLYDSDLVDLRPPAATLDRQEGALEESALLKEPKPPGSNAPRALMTFAPAIIGSR